MINDKDSVQLAESCFSVCEVLSATIQENNAGDLDESVRAVLEYSKRYLNKPRSYPLTIPSESRVMCEIERTLRRRANVSYTGNSRESVEGYMLEIQQILGTLSSLSSPLNKNPSVSERTPYLAPIETPTTTVSESGMSLASHSPALCEVLITPRLFFLDFNIAAYGRLVKREFAPDELPSLIKVILSEDEGEMIRCLPQGDAQTLIDVMDEARSAFSRYHKSVE